MVTKDCYVERAMERLTVTTMRLCSDLLKMDLQEKPAPAGFSMCGGLMARVGFGSGWGSDRWLLLFRVTSCVQSLG